MGGSVKICGGKKMDVMQRKKGIVGDRNRLVQESSYLESTVVVLG